MRTPAPNPQSAADVAASCRPSRTVRVRCETSHQIRRVRVGGGAAWVRTPSVTAGRRPVRWRRAPPRTRAEPRRAARRSPPSTASSTSAWPPAAVLERARRALHERRDAGLDAGMAFTYRDPDRSTDPSRAVPGARSIVVGARSYLADDEPERPPGPQARVARYAWVDHYAPLRVGLRAIARRLRAAGHRAVAFADDNSIVDREVAHQAGLGWFGKNANLLLPGAGSWFVLGLRRSPPPSCRSPNRWPTGAGRAGAASMPARRARSWRPAWSTPTGAWPGCCSDPVPSPVAPPGGRRPHLRLRRLPGGVPADRPPRPPPPPTARPTTPGRGSTCSTCSPPTTARCSNATAAGTSPAATRAGCAATRSSSSATPPIPPTRVVAERSPATAIGDDPVLAEHATWASARLGADRTAGPQRSREAPPRHERLPTEDRRDPVAAVGVVAAAAARSLRRADEPVRRRRRRSTARRPTGSSGPASRCCCRTRGWCAGSTSSPREVGADLVVLDPAVPLGPGRPVAAAALRRRAARRRGHGPRPAAGHASRRSATCCGGPAT